MMYENQVIFDIQNMFNKSYMIFGFKFNLNTIWTLICIICFSYQTISLLNEYLLGSTIVKIIVGRFDRENIPSITICFPYYMSFERVSKINKTYEEMFEKYKRLLNDYKHEGIGMSK